MFYTEPQFSKHSYAARVMLPSRETPVASHARALSTNRLLAALPVADIERIESHLEFVPLRLEDVLYQAGSHSRFVYFPTTSIASLVHTMVDGACAEIALIGNEGVVGVGSFMGGDTMAGCAVVSSAGGAYRLPSRVAKEEFGRGGAMQQLLLRHAQTLIVQIAQTAVCNRHHALEQQVCRRLLLNLDRLPSNEFIMTQQSIANMLGVRREGVTTAAGKLQNAGYIHYERGRITVLDRSGLESRACECYAAVKRENDRLLRMPMAA
jgi:CRP-like cAMP-binding protein